MKLTNLDLIQSVAGLHLIGQLHLPVRVSHRLAGVLRQAQVLNQDYEASRLKLIDQFGKKDNQGKLVEERDNQGQTVAVFEDRQGFDDELKTLQAIEVDIPGEPLKLDDLGNVNLPASILAALHWLIVA